MRKGISIAMACYNGAGYIAQQLQSIFLQTLKPQEIIIVDDCSTDDTIQLLLELQNKHPFLIKLYKNDTNLGPVKSFKKAISLCNFDYIALADQDDIWELNKLELCSSHLERIHEDGIPVMVYSDLKVIDSNGTLLAPSFWDLQGYRPKQTGFSDLLIGNIVTGCTIMLNVEMKHEIELMPDQVIMHDHWIALVAYGIGRVEAISDTPIKYRVHHSSVTNKSRISLRGRLKLFFKNITDFKGTYLKENIEQAKKFQELYRGRLDSDRLAATAKIISLSPRKSWYRKFYIGFTKYINR
ncbi:glycosyltransferase family 2 protein [Pedobacter sp. P26]|uniref:glycosyltransferase family 2 protein n=1 Tax=Pedobacter sp. P26 TaxID=3423956 RepID=UPI003D673BB8